MEEEPEPKKPRVKSANFTSVELEMIMTYFIPRYREWVQQLVPGGSKTTKQSSKRLLVEDIVSYLNKQDGSIKRDYNQVFNRIRDDLARVRKIISDQVSNQTGTGGGPGKHIPPTPSYLQPLEAFLRKEESLTGIVGSLESTDIGPVEVPGGDQINQDLNLDGSLPPSPIRKMEHKSGVGAEVKTPVAELRSRTRDRLSRSEKGRSDAMEFYNTREKILNEELRWWRAKSELVELQLEQERQKVALSEERRVQEQQEHDLKMQALQSKVDFYSLLVTSNQENIPPQTISLPGNVPNVYHDPFSAYNHNIKLP